MITPNSLEEIASYVEQDGKKVFAYMDLAKVWDVYGIPSLVVLEKDKEIGRFVNRDRKTKAQITAFLAGLK